MPSDLGLYLTAINKSKKNVMRDPDNNDPGVITGYPAFLVRRLLSYHADAIFHANEMNIKPHLDNQLQFEFLLLALPRKNRYAQTHKTPVVDDVELIKRYYNYSDAKALEVLPLHKPEDIERIREMFSEGGVVKK